MSLLRMLGTNGREKDPDHLLGRRRTDEVKPSGHMTARPELFRSQIGSHPELKHLYVVPFQSPDPELVLNVSEVTAALARGNI